MKSRWGLLGWLTAIHALATLVSSMSLFGLGWMLPSQRPHLRQEISQRMWDITSQPLLPVVERIDVWQGTLLSSALPFWILLNSVFIVGVGYCIYSGIRYLAHARS